MFRTIAALLIAAVSAVAIAQAPANPPVRIRGTVEKIDGTNLTIKANNGQDMNVKLADNYVVIGIAKAALRTVRQPAHDSPENHGSKTSGSPMAPMMLNAGLCIVIPATVIGVSKNFQR